MLLFLVNKHISTTLYLFPPTVSLNTPCRRRVLPGAALWSLSLCLELYASCPARLLRKFPSETSKQMWNVYGIVWVKCDWLQSQNKLLIGTEKKTTSKWAFEIITLEVPYMQYKQKGKGGSILAGTTEIHVAGSLQCSLQKFFPQPTCLCEKICAQGWLR